jgi:hypothetical protein
MVADWVVYLVATMVEKKVASKAELRAGQWAARTADQKVLTTAVLTAAR